MKNNNNFAKHSPTTFTLHTFCTNNQYIIDNMLLKSMLYKYYQKQKQYQHNIYLYGKCYTHMIHLKKIL